MMFKHPRQLLLISLFIFLGNTYSVGVAQNNEVSKIIEKESFHSLTSASQKTKQIYTWVTQNIQYDTDKKYTLSFSSDEYISLAERVAIERNAVCLGYAALFKELCTHLNIPAFVVKGKVFIPGERELANHAWVVFKTEEGWQQADPTWGSGHVSGHTFTFRQNWSFYKPDPEEFIQTHYPFDPAYQLLYKPYPYTVFEDRNFQPQTDSVDFKNILEHKISNPNHIEELNRALQYKPDDTYLMHDLATQYQKRASELAKSCVEVYNRNGMLPETSDCHESVREAENYLNRAITLFDTIVEQEGPQTQMAWLNMASAKNNLKTIEILKQN